MSDLRITMGKGDIARQKCDLLGLVFVEDELGLWPGAKAADKATRGAVSQSIKRGFKGKKDEVISIPAGKESPFGMVVMAGLGKRDKLEPESYRKAGGLVTGAPDKGEKLTCHAELRDPGKPGLSLAEVSRAFVEGAILKSYRFLDYKTKDKKAAPVSTLTLFGDSKLKKGIRPGEIAAHAQCAVRDMINRPPGELYPELFAKEARKVARDAGLEATVWKEQELKRRNMNAVLAVGKGSHNPPRLVIVKYQGAARKGLDLVLVGKGVTFDSGGISIKPSSNMDQMKGDMSGAACVLHAVAAAKKLGLKVNATAVMPLAENLPGGGAQRPGDVIRTASGLTVEVMNTDAEGRLVLGDALHYAVSLKPKHGVVDVATLTGACAIALGSQAIGLMGNNEELLGKISAAAHASGDRTWILPAWDEYEELIESKVADIINTSTRREAGTIVGGMFLKQFVGEAPWAHLDIASVFWNPKAGPYLSGGPSGRGTRLLIRLIENLR